MRSEAALTPELADGLLRAHYIYVTTYSREGKPGTVPTWCWLHEDAVYFTTQRASLKARRIKKGSPLEEGGFIPLSNFDDQARATLQSVFPNREIIGIDCTDLVWGLGAFHCVTQQWPAIPKA